MMHLRAFFDIILMNYASKYDLTKTSERIKSNSDLVNLFCKIQEIIRPPMTIEIGACWAEFSIKMAGLGLNAIAFEANPYNFSKISQEPSIKDSNVRYIHSAVGKNTGYADFHIQKKLDGKEIDVAAIRGNNSLLCRKYGEVEYEVAKVPIITLTDFFQQNNFTGHNYSAWIDAEGAAGDVLTGAETVLDTCMSIMIEVEQGEGWLGQTICPEIMDFLLDKNFVPIARDFEYIHQYNIIFLSQHLLDNPLVRDALVMYFSR